MESWRARRRESECEQGVAKSKLRVRESKRGREGKEINYLSYFKGEIKSVESENTENRYIEK